MSSNDPEYYRQRAEVERVMAAEAEDPKAAAIHEALALEYTKLAASLDMGEASRWQGFLQNKGR